MEGKAKILAPHEMETVAARLSRAYPYIRNKKQAEGVFGEAPLDSLIRGILSQHTSDINRDRAYSTLRERFTSWDAVADAPLDELNDAVHATNYSYTKAQRIKAILCQLREEHGKPTLDFLYDWPTERVLEYLKSFPGVGEKTADIVCLFTLKRPVIPVDVHVLRVTGRLGWIGPKDTAERAHKVLQQLIPCELIFPLHIGFWEHGHTTCRPVPKCVQCAIYQFCVYSAKTAPEPSVDEAISMTAGKYQQAA